MCVLNYVIVHLSLETRTQHSEGLSISHIISFTIHIRALRTTYYWVCGCV